MELDKINNKTNTSDGSILSRKRGVHAKGLPMGMPLNQLVLPSTGMTVPPRSSAMEDPNRTRHGSNGSSVSLDKIKSNNPLAGSHEERRRDQ